MRIIGGKLKRRIITAPATLDVRPTTDMAKEALFSIINNNFDFTDIDVLDIFAGTGNISYEFASREAISVLAVDSNPKSVSFIKETSDKFQLDNLQVINNDALRFLEICKRKFDVIFADPPYDYEHYHKIPELVFSKQLLKEDGWLIVEHPASIKFNEHNTFFEHRKYGKVNFSFFSNVS